MSLGMILIFGVYVFFLIWNIFYNGKKQREENYPNLDVHKVDVIDMDGIIKKSMKYITQHPIKKSDLGFHGNLFGGKLLEK